MTEVVTISVERLKKLEELEAKVKAQNKRKNNKPHRKARNLESLAKLLEKKADSPVPIHVPTNKTTSTERVLRHIAANRDEYNAKRRERRRLQKEALNLSLEQTQQTNPSEDG